jgi:hypothetical protein
LSENVYGVADALEELPASPFLATTDAGGITAGPALRRGIAVACDGGSTAIPSGSRGTLVRVSGADPTSLVWASNQLAPVPARPALLLSPELASNGTLSLRCSGPRSLTVDVNDAVFPARA